MISDFPRPWVETRRLDLKLTRNLGYHVADIEERDTRRPVDVGHVHVFLHSGDTSVGDIGSADQFMWTAFNGFDGCMHLPVQIVDDEAQGEHGKHADVTARQQR